MKYLPSLLMFCLSALAQDNPYYCPMHPSVKSETPSKCPDCGMKLVLPDKEAKNRTELKRLPSVRVWDLKNNLVDAATLSNDGKPFLLMFWATWCSPCVKELSNVAELYGDWQKKYGIKIFAVSVDDSRSSSRVSAVVQGKRWEYDILLDKNQDLMRALNFQMPPFTVLLNGNGDVVWTHNSYVEGDEYELEERIKKLAGSRQ